MPFLEILTRCYRRPNLLRINQESLRRQIGTDWIQTLLIDDVGRGIGWSYQNMAAYTSRLIGDYIWILDDDDRCMNRRLVEELHNLARVSDPDVIMLKMNCGERGIQPDSAHWGQPPVQGHVSVSSFVVRRGLWQAHAAAMCSGQYAADYEFVASIWQDRPKVIWHDRIGAKVQRISLGQPE